MRELSKIISKDKDGYRTIYKMDCENGLGLMTVYEVFSGISLIYNDFEAATLLLQTKQSVADIANQVGCQLPIT